MCNPMILRQVTPLFHRQSSLLYSRGIGVQEMEGSRRSIVLSLLLALIPLTFALTLSIPSTYALPPSVNDANVITVDVDGQLNICNPASPCLTAKVQVNASGPDTEDLTGTLLIHRIAPSPPKPALAM